MKLRYEKPEVTERDLALGRLTEKIESDPDFSFAREFADAFPDGGLYLVGGSVRDIILERPCKDYDFVACGADTETLEAFLKERGKVDLVGKRFGVFKFVPNGSEMDEPFDIALPRTEEAGGSGGYRDFNVQADPNLPVEDDLKRRDLTMNAMAWDVAKSHLVDPHEGLFDILEKKVRAVGIPKERFAEDYSRMLRALRQAAQFGFEIEEETWDALKIEMRHLNDARDGERVVPYEVIGRELLKGLKADAVGTMDFWDASGAMEQVMPELLKMKGCEQPVEYHSEGDVWAHTRLALERLSSDGFREVFGDREPSMNVIVATLLHDIGKPVSMQTPETDGVSRISFNGHDKAGEPIAEGVARRLKLSSVSGFGVSPTHIGWLVKEHMFLHNTDPEEVKTSTLAKRLFHPNHNGIDLLMLTYTDAAAGLRPDGKSDTHRLRQYVEKYEEMKSTLEKKGGRPKPLLNGRRIMEIMGMKPGRDVKLVMDHLMDMEGEGTLKDVRDAEVYLAGKKENVMRFLKALREITA